MTASPHRCIGVVTGGPSDVGMILPILERLRQEPELRFALIATGMHLAPEFGLTVRELEEAGFLIQERVECLLSSDTPEGIGKSIGVGVMGFAQLFARWRPDLLLIVGDRFEMAAAAIAALPWNIPLVHLHGGELTQGAIDDNMRHALTKLSHLHFASTATYAKRLLQMGEESWRVVVSGAPSLDALRTRPLLSPQELQRRFGVHLEGSPLLITYHPVTLEYEQTEWQAGQLLTALERFDVPMIFTLPNADTNGRVITRMINEFVKQHDKVWLVENFGSQAYFSLMACAAAMVGNSSSGIIEAPSFRLPVVNIGTRQQGRVRAENVIDVGYRHEEIAAGIREALSPGFRKRLDHLSNPYGTGQAAELIVTHLRDVPLDERLIQKRFVDMPSDMSSWTTPRAVEHVS